MNIFDKRHINVVDANNYYFQNNCAYTEDDLCVHNLFVSKIPISTTEKKLLAYFTTFGDVAKLLFITDQKLKRRRKPKMKAGFVNFTDPVVAAKVLLQKHFIGSQQICVKACDSWNQPGAQTASVNESEAPDNSYNSSALNILNLNDDCLELIAKKLELRDQTAMARTCTRFSDIIEMCSRVEHKTINFENFKKMTTWAIRDFFLLCGNSVETIRGAMPEKKCDRIAELIANNCPNMKRIYFDTCILNENVLPKFTKSLKKVTELELRNCSLHDNAVKILKKLPQLEILLLSDNRGLTGKYISQLTTVRELDLHGCSSIQTTQFINIIKAMQELRTLNIQKCTFLSTTVLEEMEKHCPKLKFLRMSHAAMTYDSIARLPALKRLELIGELSTFSGSLFRALAEHKSSQLVHLRFTARNCINLERARHIAELTKLKHLVLGHNEQLTDDCLRRFGDLDQLEEIEMRDCQNITNDGLLSLMRRCTKLRSVNIQCCINITDDFILEVIELLSVRRKALPPHHKSEPVVFYVLNSGINEFIMNHPKCQNVSDIIKISFYCTVSMLLMGVEDNMNIIDYLGNDGYDDYEDLESIDNDDNDLEFLEEFDDNDDYDFYDDLDDREDEEEDYLNDRAVQEEQAEAEEQDYLNDRAVQEEEAEAEAQDYLNDIAVQEEQAEQEFENDKLWNPDIEELENDTFDNVFDNAYDYPEMDDEQQYLMLDEVNIYDDFD